MSVEIYGLYDPDTDELRYIGKANDAQKRLKKHIEERHNRRPICAWVKAIVESGKSPVVRVIEVVPQDQWEEAERRLIAHHRLNSRLLNIADGGAMPSQTSEQRRKAAKASYKAQTQTEALKRVARAKLETGRLYKKLVREKAWLHAYHMRFMMRCHAADSPDLYGCWASL
jgi:hypothetical protein